MTQNMEAEYSKFIGTPDENKTLECKIANDIQKQYTYQVYLDSYILTLISHKSLYIVLDFYSLSSLIFNYI